MNMMWKDNIENVWYGPACFPMDDLRDLHNDGLNILTFILEQFILRERSEGTKWHVPNEDDWRNYWCLILYDLSNQTGDKFAKIPILVTKYYKNVYLTDKDGNQCKRR